MDLAKAEPRRIAALIITGRLEIGEVSFRRRSMVEACVETLKAEAAAKAEAEAEAAAKKPKPKAAKGIEDDKK